MSESLPELPTGGTVRPITRWGAAVMHYMQEPVTEFVPDRPGPVGLRVRLPR
jgi:hypothetical protein